MAPKKKKDAKKKEAKLTEIVPEAAIVEPRCAVCGTEIEKWGLHLACCSAAICESCEVTTKTLEKCSCCGEAQPRNETESISLCQTTRRPCGRALSISLGTRPLRSERFERRLRKGAARGDAEAMDMLAGLLEDADPREAVKLRRLAAKQVLLERAASRVRVSLDNDLGSCRFFF